MSEHGQSTRSQSPSQSPSPSPSSAPVEPQRSTSSDTARFKPLFETEATAPTPDSHRPTPPPAHPHGQEFVNLAAKHVFPGHPTPPAEGEQEESKDVTREASLPKAQGGDQEDAGSGEEKQKPIIAGTPLDEMPPATEGPLAGQGLLPLQPRKPEEKRGDSGDTLKPPVPTIHEPVAEEDEEAVQTESDMGASRPGSAGAGVRPGFPAVTHEMGSVRMGASALVSALNALPWEGEDEESSSSEDEEAPRRMGASMAPRRTFRPKISRLHSSLHTIRPMGHATPPEDDMVEVPSVTQYSDQHPLRFPFRENTIARRARSPGINELNYQFAQGRRRAASDLGDNVPSIAGLRVAGDERPPSEGSVGSIGPEERRLVEERVAAEEDIAHDEEREEIQRFHPDALDLGPVIEGQGDRLSEANVQAALREGEEGQEELIEERMDINPAEKQRVRREKLAERLMEVFGLEKREEVLEEMRCWLLRSVMLKGYMYLTRRHICFFAHMPDRENLVVKTGPLYKRSRTKLNTKYWVVLKNDVLSWFESTADPYFPKGNVSLQYASSCEAVDETRFKLRTSERKYTFSADTEATRDEWVKAIQKVMFRTQHEGESIKLIIPLEAVLEVDRAPTLEFAETIEIKCVDPEDQMSVDSYFFASFHDNEHAFSSIKRLIDERPSSELPRVSSNVSVRSTGEGTMHKRADSDTSIATVGLKKLGSVLKPFMRSGDKVDDTEADKDKEEKRSDKGLSILRARAQKQPHDSLETVRVDDAQAIVDDEEDGGYPPRQTGKPPPGMQDEGRSWTPGWIAKPASRIFGSSPSKSSLGKTPSDDRSTSTGIASTPSTRSVRGKQEVVTEVVEPIASQGDEEESEDEDLSVGHERAFNGPRLSFASTASATSEMTKTKSDYSLMEKSETGHREDEETAKKFRSVFSLNEKEELIDHFPGYLYRVLPVSGRFFVSTNYFCFRSSQLLYKTKMIIPIRDLYGLKAQKAFRFGHSGLIVVIKGHEELFLEFSSSRRRKACVALLEERMEEVRLRSERGEADPAKLEARIMEDLDETAPMERRQSIPPVSPSPMFGSTTSTFLEFKPDPMKITCLTIGSRGDVQPYIALCKGLQAEGHSTRIATHGEYKDWVEGHGIEFASVGGDPAELMQMCVDNGMFTVSFLKEGIQKFRGWLDDLLQSSWEACQGSDLLIESPSAMGGIHIAEALQIPYFRAFTMPWTRTRAYPHAFAVPEHRRGGSYNYMTYTMFDQVFWRAIAGQINRFRKHVMGIDSTTFDRLEQHKAPFLYNFSPAVVPPPLDWTEWIHVTGYWFLENAEERAAKDKDWNPPEGLVEFIDGAHDKGHKVVYIGFGSIVVSDPQEMTRCVVDAVKESGVYAILSKGWSDRGSKAKGETGDSEGADGIKYPPEIFSIDSIDHTWLFPKIDAACHHGGAGTTGASLRAGIPTVIKPFFGDQSFWAERVESLNVGSAVQKLTSESLAEALRKATSDEKQIAKAKVVGEMIRKENGVMRAIEAVYRDLEYAKSLIKPKGSDSSDDQNRDKSQYREKERHPTHPLDKVSSLLAPLSHTDIIPSLSKVRSRRRSSGAGSSKRPDTRIPASLQDGKAHEKRSSVGGGGARMSVSNSTTSDVSGSEESWDVVSDGARSRSESLLGSPPIGSF